MGPILSALVWKQLHQRYYRNWVPYLLTLLYPLLSMGAFTLIFTNIARVGSEGVPYPLFSFTGLVPWFFFATSLRSACSSMTSNANLVTRLKFPRSALPLAAMLAEVPALCLNFAVLLTLLLRFGYRPDGALLWIIPLLLIQTLFLTGACLIVSVTNAYSRATMTLLGPLLQAWLVASPVVYSLEIVPARHRAVYLLNPMAGIIDGWRKVLLHHRAPEAGPLVAALLVSAALAGFGWLLFRSLEKNVADVVA